MSSLERSHGGTVDGKYVKENMKSSSRSQENAHKINEEETSTRNWHWLTRVHLENGR